MKCPWELQCLVVFVLVHSTCAVSTNGRRDAQHLDYVKYPWYAFLLEDNEEGSFCGGSLISQRHVLTAAHCFNGRTSRLEAIYQVTLGLYDRCHPGPEARSFQVAHVQVHASYKALEQFDDIALVTLATDNAGFTPIILPQPGDRTNTATHAYIIGFGATPTEHEPCSMSEAKLPLLTRKECSHAHYDAHIRKSLGRTNKALCAGYVHGGWSACDGDSGGPLMVKSSGRYYIKGIISFVPPSGCSDTATVFTNVANYIPWIVNAMKSGPSDSVPS